ncbi:MAG: hypothetical protein IPO90_17375 [Flavobacteriales bacterium]|nr:hypothetical protein [Flavobacteriales bacterium]
MTRRTGNGEILTEDVLLINPEDATKHGIAEGDMVCVESARAKWTSRPDHRRGEAGILSEHLPLPGNDAEPDHQQRERLTGHVPEYKVVTCRIREGPEDALCEAGEVVAKA